ncbi:MAG: PD-(D/E)XK nuclease family protein [Acidobacteria bacterium]|nr:PD-(D/E)XK nuclease family protein [Acidobacteriota bacterium]
MTRRIFVSSSSTERLGIAAEHFRSLESNGEIVVLAETLGAADDFVRSCLPENAGFCGAHRMTLRQLAATLAAAATGERELTPVSRLGMEAIAARSVYACGAAGVLEYFGPVADTPGFPRALAATLTELRLQGVSVDRLASVGAPGRDLALLQARYEKELAERSLADLAILFQLAGDVAAHGGHRLLGLPVFLLDCSLDSAAERAFITALARRSPDVLATAPVGDEESIGALEQILEVKANGLYGSEPSDTLGRLRRYLFAPQIPPVPRDTGLDQSLEFFSAGGEALEAVEIARRIRLLAELGISFDQMAILLRNPGDYLPLVEDTLRRAGIPGYFTRSAARPDPSGRAFLALLACAAEGLTASRFAEYLSLGQVPQGGRESEWAAPEDELLSNLKTIPPPAEEPQPPVSETHESPVISGTLRAPFDWEKLLVDAAVIGGQDRWLRRLKGLEVEFRLQLEQLDQEGDPGRERLEKQTERLQNLQQFALPIIDFLGSLPASARWKEWLERLAGLAGMVLREPDSVLTVLNELQPMDEVGPVTVDEVRGVLTERLSSLRREPPQRRYGRVFVGPIGEARGRSFEVVFLPGLAEGLFPRKSFEDPLLLDEHRKKLAASLLLEDQRVARERLLLRLAAGAARSRFIASYPRMDVAAGRPRVPSFYALEIWRAAEGRLPDLREMEKRAAQAAPSQLGWPAPRDTGEAIDEAEYDLAYLSGLLERGERGAAAARGAGRYLLEANPHLARSLRARWRRWNRPSWSEADGIVDPDPKTREILATHSLRARSYSPTALQHFAACPYRFLLYSIHQLRSREEATALEQLDPLTRGSLFHAVQFELLRELKVAGLLPVQAANLSLVLDILDAVLARVATKYAEDLAPAIPRVWKSGIEEIRTDLRGWILELVSLHAEWLPVHFEFAFGLPADPGRDPESSAGEAVILDGLHLRGSIDLIEKSAVRGLLRVTDHKTGKAPEPPPVWIGGGEILQPLLYGLAAEKLLGQKVESGQLFYATQRGNYTRIEIALDNPARLRAAHVAETIDEAVRQGFLPAAPRRNACEYCDYRPICGPYEERKVAKKKKDRLEQLQDLRNIP